MNAVRKKTILNDTPYAVVMLSPNIILFFAFMLFPIIWTFVMSLSKYDLITPMQFIGITNFINIFKDEVALQCLRNTVAFTFITVPAGLVLSLFLAVLLDSGILFKKIYRAAFFLPSITSWVAIAVVWQWLYNPEFGLINYFLSFFGVPSIQWLTTSKLSLISVCIVCIWKNAGYGMLLFLAGLQSISSVYYEAGELDGANPLQQLIHITIPLLTPTTFFVFVTSIIGSFQTFDIINLMTKGGPGRSSSLLAHYLYQTAFKYMKMGYASALAYLLFFVIMVITIINMQFEKKSHEIY
ncbi:MAG: sugar ABC transporter permease [Treponema sp.]|jgi:multiple sugar transport system permease protein|nr:sugar ABC transporter permease [Treponema sp.]